MPKETLTSESANLSKSMRLQNACNPLDDTALWERLNGLERSGLIAAVKYVAVKWPYTDSNFLFFNVETQHARDRVWRGAISPESAFQSGELRQQRSLSNTKQLASGPTLVQILNSWALTLLCLHLAAPVQLSRLQKAEGSNRLPGEAPIYKTQRVGFRTYSV